MLITLAFMNRATDTIICTGPSEVAVMGMTHWMTASVAPTARHTIIGLVLKKS